MILPKKLQSGDEIRVIAPSRSARILSEQGIQQAKKSLEKLGLVVTFGNNIFENDLQNSATIDHRLNDLHEAFEDSNVKGIITVIGFRTFLHQGKYAAVK
ncbi:LD-carboxypeptidase [Bacillus sp. MUM 13]|uniref:LD-carboxypeptidase n=1 Tax=Bacillus sp. MUM 13 TaxID=1678001 RepID=UPI0009F40ED4